MKKIAALALCLLLCVSSLTLAAGEPAYKPGDTVTLGRWGGESIEWLVLEAPGDGTYVMMSVKALTSRPYNTASGNTDWESCSLRAWLNGTFLETAFTAQERALLVLSHLPNPDNATYGIEGGADTDDYVYLLSLNEAKTYIREKTDRMCEPSAAAQEEGAYGSSDFKLNGVGACWWWLRSPGETASDAGCVGSGGAVYDAGNYTTDRTVCARPVIRFRPAQSAEEPTWVCAVCGQTNVKNFCSNCGTMRAPVSDAPVSHRVGDTVTFGTYAGEAVDWLVLDEPEEGVYVMMSVKALDARAYNEAGGSTDWESCTLRAWLNGEFYRTAFTAQERAKILLAHLPNPDNAYYGIEGGADTDDHVYLLSLNEAKTYIREKEARMCEPGAYAIGRGAYQSSDFMRNGVGACWWWLRSPGQTASDAGCVGSGGAVYDDGNSAADATVCVRPVIQVRF